MRRRAAAVAAVGLALGLLWWWLGAREAEEARSARSQGAAGGAGPQAQPSRWSQPITVRRGARRLEGRVVQDGRPVGGALVTALVAHGEDVLSDLPCTCDNHCGRKLLECGCPEAAGQLVELVAARTGEPAPVARGVSDAEGHFALEGLDDGELALWADAPSGIAFRAGLHAGDAALELELGPGRTIDGVVTGGDDAPLAAALVTAIYAEQSRFFEATTDATGHYHLGPLLAGSYAVVATAPGLLPDHQQVGAEDTAPVALKLAAPRSLGGLVRAAGAPVPGATVSLEGMHRKRTATTDAAGRFRFERLRPGNYSLEASAAPGRAQASSALSRGADRDDVALDLMRGRELRGTVADEAGGVLAGARVSLSEGKRWRHVTSDGEGRFAFDAVRPGAAWVSASLAGYLQPESVQVEVAEDQPALVLTLRRASMLAGRVVGPDGGAVLVFSVSAEAARDAGGSTPGALELDDAEEFAGAVPGRGREVAAGASRDGGFALEVPPGDYLLRVTARGHAEATLPAHAPATSLLVSLRSGGRIAGVALDADGVPLAGASIFDTAPAGPGRPGRTDRLGRFELTGLEPGRHQLEARQLEAQPGRVSAGTAGAVAMVREGETAVVELRLRRGVAVEGVVVTHAGRPAPGARVMVEGFPGGDGGSDEWTFAVVEADPEGRFRVTDLPGGPVRLSASLDRHRRSPTASRVVPPAAGVRLTVEGDTSVSGRVVDEAGAPVLEFKVTGRPFDTTDGRFSVPAAPGPMLLALDAQGHAQHVRTVEVKEGLNDLGDLKLSRGLWLEGRVFELGSGRGVEGALVDVGVAPGPPEGPPAFNLAEERGAVRTDAQGRFRLLIDPRSATLLVAHPDFVPAQRTLQGAVRLEVGLMRGLPVEVRVLDAAGQPLASPAMQVWGTGPEGRLAGLTPAGGQAGVWRARALAPGSWFFQAQHPRRVLRPARLEVGGPGPLSVTLREATGGVDVVVHGTPQVMLVAGPLPRTPSARDLDALRTRETMSASTGRFEHVPPGSWSLLAWRSTDEEEGQLLVLPLEVGAEPLSVTLPAEGWVKAPGAP